MTLLSPDEVKQIGIVGAGTIGSAWVAHFLARGLDVIATDPSPGAEKKLRASVVTLWPVLTKLGLASNASLDRLRFTSSIDEKFEGADFIQESTPEQEDIKDKVMAAISDVVSPHTVIASSTSGIIPSRLQMHCKNPGRMIVGHPFNPVHLVPLVEVVGGKQTAREVIDWAMQFYKCWGKSPVHCRVETPGHLANRLQDAVLSEALQIIAEGTANTMELDAAMSCGPGLRWGLMGPLLTAHMAAGEGGLYDVLTGKFGTSYYSHFQGPDLNQEDISRLMEDIESQTTGYSLATMEKMRDEFLLGVLKLRTDIEGKYGFDRGCFVPIKTASRTFNL